MIVRPPPGAFGLLFTLRGSIVPMIAARLALVLVISTLVSRCTGSNSNTSVT